MDFRDKLNSYIEMVNSALKEYIKVSERPEKKIYSAMEYSILAGGKRLRPVLALAVCDMLNGDENDVLPYACAVEMIHTYSLIHDDLPSMDNDDYRRGRLTNHKVFGEAMAVLAGDSLLNYAFEIMLDDAVKGEQSVLSLSKKVKAMDIIAKSSGARGMIGGQVVDLESEGKEITAEVLEYMHRCKTGALIKAPIMAAAVICNADKDTMFSLEKFAVNLGLAFQIKDDILDVEGNSEMMGKTVGSDEGNNKSTFVSLHGLEKSKVLLNKVTDEAISSISELGDKAAFLVQLAEYLVKREN
jgi:geranylgeranyl diphosphate synthase type II